MVPLRNVASRRRIYFKHTLIRYSINLPVMRFRRSIGFLSTVCVLSLTIGRSTSSCERSSVDLHRAVDAHASSDMDTKHHDRQEKPCKTATVVCCKAMTSCGFSLKLDGTISVGRAPSSGNELPTGPLQVAITHVSPPDPPPPKA